MRLKDVDPQLANRLLSHYSSLCERRGVQWKPCPPVLPMCPIIPEHLRKKKVAPKGPCWDRDKTDRDRVAMVVRLYWNMFFVTGTRYDAFVKSYRWSFPEYVTILDLLMAGV